MFGEINLKRVLEVGLTLGLGLTLAKVLIQVLALMQQRLANALVSLAKNPSLLQILTQIMERVLTKVLQLPPPQARELAHVLARILTQLIQGKTLLQTLKLSSQPLTPAQKMLLPLTSQQVEEALERAKMIRPPKILIDTQIQEPTWPTALQMQSVAKYTMVMLKELPLLKEPQLPLLKKLELTDVEILQPYLFSIKM